MDLVVAVGSVLRARREQMGLSQEALGAVAGVHRTYVGMVERAERSLTVASLHRLSRALAIPASDVLRAAEAKIPGVGSSVTGEGR